MKSGCLVLETGEIFKGFLLHESAQAGEVVFNTSHTGYEEIATDPSYYNQILVMTAPLQGNYGVDPELWQSDRFWIKGFVCLQMQNSSRDRKWLEQLRFHKVSVLSGVDTRPLTLCLREKGTVWGAVVPFSKDSFHQAVSLIEKEKSKPKDWTQSVCVQFPREFKGQRKKGPKIALIDFGFKRNILKEILKRSSRVCIFPAQSSVEEIQSWGPSGLVLSNGPGDPRDVILGTRLTQSFIQKGKPLFGICMGHQVLAQALGGKTYKLKFGHRGSNHPIKDRLLNKIYMSSQNHGYSVREDSLNKDVQISHINLNDHTVEGIYSKQLRCMGIQFHPENHPGPRESLKLFDFFIDELLGETKHSITSQVSPRIFKKHKSNAR